VAHNLSLTWTGKVFKALAPCTIGMGDELLLTIPAELLAVALKDTAPAPPTPADPQHSIFTARLSNLADEIEYGLPDVSLGASIDEALKQTRALFLQISFGLRSLAQEAEAAPRGPVTVQGPPVALGPDTAPRAISGATIGVTLGTKDNVPGYATPDDLAKALGSAWRDVLAEVLGFPPLRPSRADGSELREVTGLVERVSYDHPCGLWFVTLAEPHATVAIEPGVYRSAERLGLAIFAGVGRTNPRRRPGGGERAIEWRLAPEGEG
jgi:hypothetical protein